MPVCLSAIVLLTVVALGIGQHAAAQGQAVAVRIISKNLSQRIVALETSEKRLKLMIGFNVTGTLPSGPKGTRATGWLSRGGVQVATTDVPRLDHSGGNLVFYLPYQVQPGAYEVLIQLTDVSSGRIVGQTRHAIGKIELLNARDGGNPHDWMQPLNIPLRNPAAEPLGALATSGDEARGYILWHRNSFQYVYPNSAPAQADVISGVSVILAQDEYEPATFSLYALRDLGNVSVSVSALTGEGGATLAAPTLYTVKTVARMKTEAGEAYEMRPRLLETEISTRVADKQSQRFWLTVHAPITAQALKYRGTIAITTSAGTIIVPLNVEVLPIRLVSRPDKQYGFDMTYEFQEMTARDLTDAQRQLVYDNGVKYYRSFREHGLTTVIAHSPFVFQRLPNGDPDLRDLHAALKAFKIAGFTGPFVYYCGHLVQNSKPGWAGSTLGYDSARHPALMKEIIAYARANFPEMNEVDVYWMPGDEVQDSQGGRDRMQIAKELLDAIEAMQEKTAIAVWGKSAAWSADITLGDPAPVRGEHWQYPNSETTMPPNVDDAERTRRAFGLAHVRSSYVGIAPWTFQASQNASGDPTSDVDTQKGSPEVMVAYPGIDGPNLTPEYEAIREGIDDGKYAYQLEIRIEQAKRSAKAAHRALGRQIDAAYQTMLSKATSATLTQMDASRQTMVSWILQLDASSRGAARYWPDQQSSRHLESDSGN